MTDVRTPKHKMKRFQKLRDIKLSFLKEPKKSAAFVQYVFREQNRKIQLVYKSLEKNNFFRWKNSDFGALPPRSAIGLLEPDDYQIFLLEPLPVPDEELASALQWRLKDLMNQPVSDVIIDYFFLPKRKSDDKSMLVAIVLDKKKQKAKLDAWKPFGSLAINRITIPEMALAGLTSLYEKGNEMSSLIFYIYQNTLVVVLTAQQTFYFCRRIELCASDGVKRPTQDIALELVRLLDYFQQQWRQPAPKRYFVVNETDSHLELLGEIQKVLSLPLQGYAFDNYYVQTDAMPTSCYLSLGALLWEHRGA